MLTVLVPQLPREAAVEFQFTCFNKLLATTSSGEIFSKHGGSFVRLLVFWGVFSYVYLIFCGALF